MYKIDENSTPKSMVSHGSPKKIALVTTNAYANANLHAEGSNIPIQSRCVVS
jgi:hypothetical protein